MSKKFLIIILLVSVAINLGVMFTVGFNLWQGRHFRRGDGPHVPGGPMPDWWKSPLRYELKLTDEQIERLNTIQRELSSKMPILMQNLLATRKALVALWMESEIDTVKADSLFRKLTTAQMEMEKQTLFHLKEISDVLTLEQRMRLFAFFERGPMSPRMPPGTMRPDEGGIK
jgi:Spy/CpxP family protein refolding chaperone